MENFVTIHDATILIDLIETSLINLPFALDFKFKTTQLAFDELDKTEKEFYSHYIDRGQLSIESCSLEIINLMHQGLIDNPKYCLQDLLAIQLASQAKCILLSNSKLVQKLAKEQGITAHNVLWLLDELRGKLMIDNSQACEYLEKLVSANPRIRDESCQKRLFTWKDEN